LDAAPAGAQPDDVAVVVHDYAVPFAPSRAHAAWVRLSSRGGAPQAAGVSVEKAAATVSFQKPKTTFMSLLYRSDAKKFQSGFTLRDDFCHQIWAVRRPTPQNIEGGRPRLGEVRRSEKNVRRHP